MLGGGNRFHKIAYVCIYAQKDEGSWQLYLLTQTATSGFKQVIYVFNDLSFTQRFNILAHF